MRPQAVLNQGFQVLTAQRGGHGIAIPAALIGRTVTLSLSAPIPGTVPWLAGVGRLGDRLLWVFDPAALGGQGGDHPVIIAPGDTPTWGIRVDRVDTLIEARRTGPLAHLPGDRWPEAWSTGCLLADGRRALLIDPQQFTAVLGQAEAA